MLILTRETGQEIIITTKSGEIIRIVQVECRGNKSRLGFEADRATIIDRKEVTERKRAA